MPVPASLPVAPPDDPDEFRFVPNMPGYCASRSGRVFSSLRWGAWRLLKPQKRSHNYYVYVVHGGREHWRKAGEMVAEAFIGPRPSPEHCILFVDKCRWNTAVYNLRWELKSVAATYYKVVGERSANAKLDAAAVVGFRKRLYLAVLEGVPFDWAGEAERLGCTTVNLRTIARGGTWGYVDAGVPLWKPGPSTMPVRAKLGVEQVRAIKLRRKRGESRKSVARSYPEVGEGAIRAIDTGRSWKHVTV